MNMEYIKKLNPIQFQRMERIVSGGKKEFCKTLIYFAEVSNRGKQAIEKTI